MRLLATNSFLGCRRVFSISEGADCIEEVAEERDGLAWVGQVLETFLSLGQVFTRF